VVVEVEVVEVLVEVLEVVVEVKFSRDVRAHQSDLRPLGKCTVA
jgi:hypothetical protein